MRSLDQHVPSGRSATLGSKGWISAAIGLLSHQAFQIICILGALLGLSATATAGESRVVAYCAQDQVYAEPIFHEFERQTGIKVLALYDNEAVKTVGLANRLVAESAHSVCDVFWGNEEMRTRQLAEQRIFRLTNGWAAFGYRSRRLVISSTKPANGTLPRSLFELTNAIWRGKVAMAYPQFGTTATHLNVLRQVWGEPVWLAWCHGFAENKPLLVDGNSEVVKAVARGDVAIGLTDSDDIADGQREGLAVTPLPMSSETLLIPNTVGVIRSAPHPEPAQRLFDYLQSRPVLEALIKAKALEGTSAATVSTPTLHPDWAAVLRDVSHTTAELNQIFLR